MVALDEQEAQRRVRKFRPNDQDGLGKLRFVAGEICGLHTALHLVGTWRCVDGLEYALEKLAIQEKLVGLLKKMPTTMVGLL